MVPDRSTKQRIARLFFREKVISNENDYELYKNKYAQIVVCDLDERIFKYFYR